VSDVTLKCGLEFVQPGPLLCRCDAAGNTFMLHISCIRPIMYFHMLILLRVSVLHLTFYVQST